MPAGLRPAVGSKHHFSLDAKEKRFFEIPKRKRQRGEFRLSPLWTPLSTTKGRVPRPLEPADSLVHRLPSFVHGCRAEALLGDSKGRNRPLVVGVGPGREDRNPWGTQRSDSPWKRTSDVMTELSAFAGSEGYEVREDENPLPGVLFFSNQIHFLFSREKRKWIWPTAGRSPADNTLRIKKGRKM